MLYTPDPTFTDETVSFYVKRHSILRPSSSGIVLKSRHTRSDIESDRHSSYIGAVFELHKGDSLYVENSAPELLSHDDIASFFGLFKVGHWKVRDRSSFWSLEFLENACLCISNVYIILGCDTSLINIKIVKPKKNQTWPFMQFYYVGWNQILLKDINSISISTFIAK